MPIHRPGQWRRHVALLMLASTWLHAETPASTLKFDKAQEKRLYEELVATGASTYTYSLLVVKDEADIRRYHQELQKIPAGIPVLPQALKREPLKTPAYAVPAILRAQLRTLYKGERSAPFLTDRGTWAIAELEDVTPGKAPKLEQVASYLPTLVERGALPSPDELTGNSALLMRSELNTVFSLLDLVRVPPLADLNMPLSDGYLLLQRATAGEDLDLVKALLKRGANPNACAMRTCVLQLAVGARAPLPLVTALLEGGAKADHLDSDHAATALTMAGAKEDLGLVQRLLDAGADIDGGSGSSSPLGMAAYAGDLAMATFLLEKGADPLRRKKLRNPAFFSTPMSGALEGRRPEMLRWMRAAALAQAARQKQYQWSGWVEQDGKKQPLASSDIHLRRKPFTLHFRLHPEATIRLEASTGTRIFEELKGDDLAAPLFNNGRVGAEGRDGKSQWLTVGADSRGSKSPPAASGDATPQDPTVPATAAAAFEERREGSLQIWGWNDKQKDFTRVDKTPQGNVYVRRIASLLYQSGSEAGEIPLEKSTLEAVNLVVGTDVGYTSLHGDFAQPRQLRLVFDLK